jgi:hypothetical protein
MFVRRPASYDAANYAAYDPTTRRLIDSGVAIGSGGGGGGGDMFKSQNLSGLANYATARSNLGLAIGTNVQAYNAHLAAIVAGTYSGAASITLVGTIVTGTWAGTAIAVDHGGTGGTTKTTGFDGLQPMTAAGDIIYGGASGSGTRLAKGTGFLRGGTTPTYSAIDLATGDVTGLLPVTQGGTGTATPGLVEGTNVTITGTWPNQTINASGGSGSPGGSNTQLQFNDSDNFGGTTPSWDVAYNFLLMNGSSLGMADNHTATTTGGNLNMSGGAILNGGTASFAAGNFFVDGGGNVTAVSYVGLNSVADNQYLSASPDEPVAPNYTVSLNVGTFDGTTGVIVLGTAQGANTLTISGRTGVGGATTWHLVLPTGPGNAGDILASIDGTGVTDWIAGSAITGLNYSQLAGTPGNPFNQPLNTTNTVLFDKINLGNTSAGGSAPTPSGGIPLTATIYGGVTSLLGEPSAWIPIDLNGSSGRIPWYGV